MDRRDFTVIENKEKEREAVKKAIRQTNPIVKNFVQFHNEKTNKFSVKDIFKLVRD